MSLRPILNVTLPINLWWQIICYKGLLDVVIVLLEYINLLHFYVCSLPNHFFYYVGIMLKPPTI